MTKVSIMLLGALIFSALYLVQVQYQSRLLFTALEQSRSHGDQLEIERARLVVEEHAQARSLRVASLAHDKLDMRAITPAITEYVAAPKDAAAAAPATTKKDGDAQ